jgi:hypothetical protein
MNDRDHGPESAPLKTYIKTYKLSVRIYDGDKLIDEKTLDYGNFEDKRYLGKLSFWAWNKGYTVETERAEGQQPVE